MACGTIDLTTGRGKWGNCGSGGIKTMYMSSDGLGEIVYDVTNTQEIVTLPGVGGVPTPPNFFKYDLQGTLNTANLGATTKDVNAGTTLTTQTAEISLKGMSVEMHKELILMVYGEPTIVLETNNGEFFLMGLEDGCNVNITEVSTGGAREDFSGYKLSVEAKEKLPANWIQDSLIATTATVSAVQLEEA